ncbi:MAG: hypothetical protein M1142_02245 [Patescibacteria group bacterium]|nr:hypothetical protein [Patescibacteria group bacterium]
MINENFVLLGIFINFLGGLSYIKDTLQGKVQPNRVSWGLWALAVAIAFSAEVSQGVGIQSLTTFMAGFMPLLIFLSSFVNKKAYWKLTKFNLLCAVLSIFGLVLWQVTKIGNLAIIFSIFADLTADIPTLVKSYKFPETGNWIEFSSSFISVSITMLTFKTWTFAYFGFPLYIFFYDVIAFLLIKFKLGKRIKVR